MSSHKKLLARILEGRSDANIRFDELRNLLRRLGFSERTRGSHHIFERGAIEEMIVLQPDGNKAKAYQVRQVRAIVLDYGLEGEV